MKKILLVLISVISLSSCQKKNLYCGPIVEKYLLHKNNGGVYNIVFYNDSVKENINVTVTASTYVNSKVKQNVCFYLFPFHLRE